MNAQEFCYWLQGFFEVTNAANVTEEQVKIIKAHLQLVFTKVTHPNLTAGDLQKICAQTGIAGISYC